jgi:Mrp family chromosome partitioning ATPase
MTLAVLNGADAGKVLRSARPRITVGASRDNDLVLTDVDVQAHHFTIVVDEGGWRAQTSSSKHQIVIDRRWSHPNTGRRGALIYAGGTEILLFPGELDDSTIDHELKLRKTADVTIPETERSNDVTRIADRATRFSRDMRSLPPEPIEDESAAPTLYLPAMSRSAAAAEAMPTLSAAAKASRPETDGKAKRSAWDKAIVTPEAPARRRTDTPEVLAEPESQMVSVPGSEHSVVTPLSMPAVPRALVRAEPEKQPRNAWGDRRAEEKESERKNAWGDSGKRESGPPKSDPPQRTSAPPKAGGNRWNTRAAKDEPPPIGAQNRLPQLYTGRQIDALHLSKSNDPALEIVRTPDGDFATAVRVFGTRINELARTYGYRTYMITSAEPLTGKTTVAVNLAFALAEDPKRRVALIEANFRYPRLAEILGVPEEIGLIGVLEGRLQVPEAIVKIADRNLVAFPAGGRHPHPAEVLASPRFKTLIAELAGTVDVAIVDAPSVRPFADANLILPLVDGAMMVVLEECTRGIWIDQAMEQLGKERVLGALYNRLDRTQRRTLTTERKDRIEAGRG